jgi:NAD(P)H-hydrate epimerase
MESDMHKGRAGHVLVLGGSPGMTGAPVLSSLGALRSGAGLATLAVPEDLAPAVPRSFPDIMIHTFAHQSRWTAEIARDLDRFFRCTAWVVGPGLGRDKETTAFVAALLDQLDTLPPVLFDADGLYHLAKLSPRHLNIQKTVLTPHPGEAATLLQGPIPETFAQRSEAAETLARKYRCTVVLKGAATLVAAPGHPLSVAPFAEPCLAVAGSGDVLSGIIGSLLARGLEPLTAACLGVYWHGLCGRSLSRRFPLRGNLATDIANALPQTLKELAS